MSNQGPKNERQILMGIATLMLLLIFLDYIIIFKNYSLPGIKKFNILVAVVSAFHQFGELIRAIYVFAFAMLCYVAYSNQLLKKSRYTSATSSTALLALSLLSSALFIECFRLPYSFTIIAYPILCITSSILIMLLMASLSHEIADEDGKTSLTLEKEPTKKEWGITLYAHNGVINIPNPFRSISIIGGAGAGKSASLIEPILFDMIRKGYTGSLYDFKYPTLGEFVYSAFLYHKSSMPPEEKEKVKLYSITFTELERSHRFNPIDPKILTSSTYAEEFSGALYSNLDKEAKKGGFFPDSATGLLKAVMWFLRKNHPQYCTLPHVVNVLLSASTEDLVNMLVADEECLGMVKPVKEAAEKKAYDQLAGVVGSLTMQLQKINTPEIVWVLTGTDFTLDINNPDDPKFVILGSRPDLRSALNPVLAFIITIILRTVNSPNKLPFVSAIDELPTLYIPGLDSFPATARSNKCVSLIAGQDRSQYISQYTKDVTNSLLANHAYSFVGNTSDMETAKSVSDMVGEVYVEIASYNKGGNQSESGDSSSKGVSYSQQKRKIVESQEMMELTQGEFVGKLVDSEKTWVRGKLKRIVDACPDFKLVEIPEFVENFMLDATDVSNANSQVHEILANLDYYRQHDKEINIAYNKDQKSTQKGNLHLNQLLQGRIKDQKKQSIIIENFRKVQDEVKNIIIQYADTSAIDNLIKN